MKRNLLLFLLIAYTLNFTAQTSFEKGYFINNSDEKVECYIENLDLLFNPKKFNYKLDANGKELSASINEVKVFEIYNISKYENHTVDIDRSSISDKEISNNRKANFKKEKLFLKVLVEGKATLYYYAESNFYRFFFKHNNSKIEQLVFKTFSDSFDPTVVKKNERYKQQLINSFNCKSISEKKIVSLKYRKNELTSLFVDYNKCFGGNYKNYTLKNSKTTKSYYNFNLTTGLNAMSFSILDFKFRNETALRFENKIALRFGIEVEYIMGFNNNKWAFVVEPNFLNFSSVYNDRTERVTGADNSAKINYNAIDLPIGIRYYMYLNKTSKFFINGFLVPSITIKSEIRSIGVDENNPLNFDGRSDINYALGLGYKYNNKFSVELRTSSQRDLLNAVGPVRFNTVFYNSSIIIGYKLF